MLREREAALRQRDKSSEIEIARREDTIREPETRIAWLEGQVRRLETPRLPLCTDDLRIRLKDVATCLPGWCPEEARCGWPIRSFRKGTKQRRNSASMRDVRCSRSPRQLRQTKGTQSTQSTLGITPRRQRRRPVNGTTSSGTRWTWSPSRASSSVKQFLRTWSVILKSLNCRPRKCVKRLHDLLEEVSISSISTARTPKRRRFRR
jgi:hypothetical protein